MTAAYNHPLGWGDCIVESTEEHTLAYKLVFLNRWVSGMFFNRRKMFCRFKHKYFKTSFDKIVFNLIRHIKLLINLIIRILGINFTTKFKLMFKCWKLELCDWINIKHRSDERRQKDLMLLSAWNFILLCTYLRKILFNILQKHCETCFSLAESDISLETL